MDVYKEETESYSTDNEEEWDADTKESILKEKTICCKNQCMLSFDDQFKCRLKSDLSKLSKKEKYIFLFGMISINEDKKNDPTISKSSKYFQYTVKEYGIPRTVCKSAFVSMHDTTPSLVRTLCLKMNQDHLIPTDKRGRQDQQATISDEKKESIKTHFFKTLESPNIFKCSKKRSGQPNITQLWLDYKKKHVGILSRSTYTKYIRSFLTEDILSKFFCANEAHLILIQLNNKYKEH